ncbi:hypothetical protein M5D96_014066, partial [Drosophila gunungcola]
RSDFPGPSKNSLCVISVKVIRLIRLFTYSSLISFFGKDLELLISVRSTTCSISLLLFLLAIPWHSNFLCLLRFCVKSPCIITYFSTRSKRTLSLIEPFIRVTNSLKAFDSS